MSEAGQLAATVNAHAAVACAVRLNLSGNADPVWLAGAALPRVVLPMVSFKSSCSDIEVDGRARRRA